MNKVFKVVMIIMIYGMVFGVENNTTQIVQPMNVEQAVNWDTYIEITPIERGIALDTRNARNQTLIVHSYQVVLINEKPFLLVSYLRPRESVVQAMVDIQRVEDAKRAYFDKRDAAVKIKEK